MWHPYKTSGIKFLRRFVNNQRVDFFSGLVNLRPPTTVFLQATSAIKRRRGRPRRRALAGARACAQRVLCSALALALA